MKNTETVILHYLKKNWRRILPKFKLISVNPVIHGVYSDKIIGYADFLFRRGNKHFIAELKYSDDISTDIWGSLKAIGYAKAYELETGFAVQPVVILKKEAITNDTRCLFYSLKLDYITVERTIDGIFIEYDFK